VSDEEISANEARRNFGDILGAVEHGEAHVTVTKYGKPVAVVVPAEWHDGVQKVLERHPAICHVCYKDVPVGAYACEECVAIGEAARQAIIRQQQGEKP